MTLELCSFYYFRKFKTAHFTRKAVLTNAFLNAHCVFITVLVPGDRKISTTRPASSRLKWSGTMFNTCPRYLWQLSHSGQLPRGPGEWTQEWWGGVPARLPGLGQLVRSWSAAGAGLGAWMILIEGFWAPLWSQVRFSCSSITQFWWLSGIEVEANRSARACSILAPRQGLAAIVSWDA